MHIFLSIHVKCRRYQFWSKAMISEVKQRHNTRHNSTGINSKSQKSLPYFFNNLRLCYEDWSMYNAYHSILIYFFIKSDPLLEK